MTMSRDSTTIDAGMSDASTTHVGVNAGHKKPTSTPPATSRTSKIPCMINAIKDTLVPSVNFHNNY